MIRPTTNPSPVGSGFHAVAQPSRGPKQSVVFSCGGLGVCGF